MLAIQNTRRTMPYIMNISHEIGRAKQFSAKWGRRGFIGGVALVAIGGIGYGGYKVREWVEPKAYEDGMPESTQIACAAPSAISEKDANGTVMVNLVAHLIKTGTGSEKVKTVIITGADSKPLTPQKNFDDAQYTMGANLVSPEAAKSDTVSHIQLSPQELGYASNVGMIFGTSSGKIVRCALANVVTQPAQDLPSLPPTPSSEITIKQ